MTRWRMVTAAASLFLLGLPLFYPFAHLLSRPEGLFAWSEIERIATLGWTSLRLVALTLALSLPLGLCLAVLMERTDMPGRGLIRWLMIFWIFVPLPIVVTSWQAVLGSGGLVASNFWIGLGQDGLDWQRWSRGPLAAAIIHALAGLPWVVFLIGVGLRWVERELEEDALMCTSAWKVLWHVTLPRSRLAIGAAAAWIAVQTLGEITVTDMMEVRTYAEEAYYQFAIGQHSLQRATAVALPWVILLGLTVAMTLRRIEDRLPSLEAWSREPRIFSLGKWRWIASVVVVGMVGMAIVLPMAGLVWRAGAKGYPQQFAWSICAEQIELAIKLHAPTIVSSLGTAALTGLLTGWWALWHCWLSRGSRRFLFASFTLVVLAWTLPGPVLGIGMIDIIMKLVGLEKDVLRVSGGPIATLLYYGPSIAPVVWIQFVRSFPFAMALLWPVVRLVPSSLGDAVRVDGGGPLREAIHVIFPLTRSAFLIAVLAVSVLSLSELSASKMVVTAGARTFAQDLFDKMHNGVSNDLAALCLVLLGIVILATGILKLIVRMSKSRVLQP